jgi:predicted transcriptional regulator
VVEVQLPEDVGRHLDELATEFGISPEQTLKRMLMLYTSERKGKPAQ